MTAQLIVFLDANDNIRAEAPGRGGAVRQKIELPEDFTSRNPELLVALLEQRLERR